MDQSPQTHDSPPAPESSPRWRRAAVWLSNGMVILFLIALGLVVWAEMAARSRVNQRLIAYRAAGEWATIDDYNAMARPPEHLNAAILLRQASAGVPGLTDDCGRYDGIPLPLSGTERAALEEALADTAAAFALVAEARTRPLVDWQVTYPPSSTDMDGSHLTGQRLLAIALHQAGLLAQSKGDTATALQHAESILYVADAVGFSPGVVSHLVALRIRSLACDLLHQLDDYLADGAAVDREQVERLIALLLNETIREDAIHRAWTSERAALVSEISAMGKPWLRQHVLREVPRVADLHDAARAASMEADIASAMEAMPQPPPAGLFTIHLSEILEPSLRRSVALTFRDRTERRAAAIALAIRLRAIDHGRLPDSLEALVPSYLSELPRDPFSPQDQPLGYDRQRAILWSAGTDCVDGGGDTAILPKTKLGGELRWRTADAVFPLINPPRAAPPKE